MFFQTTISRYFHLVGQLSRVLYFRTIHSLDQGEVVDQSTRLDRSICISYGSGSLGTGLFAALPGLLLLYFMTETLGISPGLAGMGVFIPKIWDVITDPVMGGISDRTSTKWGRRRPFLLAGAILLPIFLALLFNVPEFQSPTGSFFYVTLVYILCATAYTLFQVPYIAMPAEMSGDYNERTSIMSYRMAFMTAGIMIAGAAAPMIIEAAGGGRTGYAVMSAVLAGVCLTAMMISFWGTRRAPFLDRIETSLGFADQARIARRNRPFVRLIIGFFPQQVAVGSMIASLPFYVKYILGSGNTTVTIMFVCLVLPAIVTMPLWVAISKKYGKLACYLISSSGFGGLSLILLSGRPTNLGFLFVVVAVLGTCYAGIQLFPFSMLPDAIQLDRIRSGLRREGVFTGIWTAGEKTGMAFGALLSGSLLSWGGFIESAAGQTITQPDSALTAILIAFSIAPAGLMVASLPILKRYNLSEEALRQLSPDFNASVVIGESNETSR